MLGTTTREAAERLYRPFYERMRQLGWNEGGSVSYDRLYADGQLARLPELAVKLVARKPDLIFSGSPDSALAASRATKRIPIVFGAANDPVDIGLVASLARPGGNVTGVATVFEQLAPKRLETLREALPGAKRVGLLFDARGVTSVAERNAYEKAAAALGLTLIAGGFADAREVESAIGALLGSRLDALIAAQSSTLLGERRRIVELAGAARVPVLGFRALYAEDGALVSFGTALAEQFRRAAELVDRILRGAKPADLPVEQLTKFELVINLKTAKALGLTIPQSMLLRADRVIE
jgi:putative ABC transport system substrate-binding protein